jgi:ArsR family transcriptional regulator
MVPVHSQTDGENQMKEYRQSAKMLRAMAHPVRLQILEALVHGPACVCELIVKTGRRQACISQHLMLLRQTGLVKRTRMGLNMRYELASETTTNLLKALFKDDQHECLLIQSQTLLLEESVTPEVNEKQLTSG